MVMVVFVGVIGIGIVLTIGSPVIKSSVSSGNIDEAENVLSLIDSAVKQVAQEGSGSARVVSFYSNVDGFVSLPDEDALEYSVLGNFMDYGSRLARGGVMVYAGDECSCSISDANGDNIDDIVMENDKILVALQLTGSAENPVAIDSSHNILLLKNKITDMSVPVLDNTVKISGSQLAGNGYSYLVAQGRSRPLCKAIVVIDDYRIIYTLYSGADFVVIDVLHD